MTEYGRYGDDGRAGYELPGGWLAVGDDVYTTALNNTLEALSAEAVFDRLRRYYDREGHYAGTLFLDVQPNFPNTIEPSDLYALTTLSIDVDPLQGRLLLDSSSQQRQVRRLLRSIPDDLPLTDIGSAGAEMLIRMEELHSLLRTSLGGSSNRWVFASKLCARKRPSLFPVRDNLVCELLGGWAKLSPGNGRPGNFRVDIPVYAFLVTHPEVRSLLAARRGELHESGIEVDLEDLRLLDACLWMAAKAAR